MGSQRGTSPAQEQPSNGPNGDNASPVVATATVLKQSVIPQRHRIPVSRPIYERTLALTLQSTASGAQSGPRTRSNSLHRLVPQDLLLGVDSLPAARWWRRCEPTSGTIFPIGALSFNARSAAKPAATRISTAAAPARLRASRPVCLDQSSFAWCFDQHTARHPTSAQRPTGPLCTSQSGAERDGCSS